MMAETFLPDETPLVPLGTCSMCGTVENPMIAVFWSQGEHGALCPECSGEMPTEGYAHWICYTRRDLPGQMAQMVGPYSAAEAERNLTYFAGFDNVESAWVLHLPEVK